MSITFGADPVRERVQELLLRMRSGEVVDKTHETKHVDLKEESGRRGSRGELLVGSRTNDVAAQHLAAASACMANTPGGGALIVGLSDDGELIGADLDAEWLRKRIYEITQRLLTVDVTETVVRGIRLLIVVSPSAVEPIRVNGRIQWRVDESCVEVDAATWHARRMSALNYDWSNDDSGIPVADARPQALTVAREFLDSSGDSSAEDHGRASDAQLLRRLNVVTGHDTLTNAGAIAFVGRPTPLLDYMRRDHAGADSAMRVNRGGRSLIEELSEVFLTFDASNPTRHVHAGLVVGQMREIPRIAAREAIVNGVAHREWGLTAPTVVEHVGTTLRVTSPGGFVGGVNSANIITHPSRSRNQALTQLLADLHVAEREGIGVDRMVREMLRLGYQPPVIVEKSGPMVSTSLIGDAIDVGWINWLAAIRPATESSDVSSLLLLRRLATIGWVDEESAAPLIQLPVEEAQGAIRKLATSVMRGYAVVQRISGTPESSSAVWRLSDHALDAMTELYHAAGSAVVRPSRREVARSYAAHRGRISSTELAELVGASPSNVGGTLKALAAEGELEPSSPAGRGRGFYYRWAG